VGKLNLARVRKRVGKRGPLFAAPPAARPSCAPANALANALLRPEALWRAFASQPLLRNLSSSLLTDRCCATSLRSKKAALL
jgi:hypothetical protein